MAISKKENSFLHRMDPRTKLLLTIYFTVIVFILNSLICSAAMMFFFISVCFASGLSLKKVFSKWKFIVFLVIFILLMQTFFFAGYASPSFEGFLHGIMISCRVITIFVMMHIFSFTTDHGKLAYGITKLGINYKAAFIITSTLNIIPSLSESMRQCINAYRMRSPNAFKKKSIFSHFKEYSIIAIPVLVKAFRRSSLLALAMDARAFGIYKKRTWVVKLKFSKIDYLAYIVLLVFSVTLIFLNFNKRLIFWMI